MPPENASFVLILGTNNTTSHTQHVRGFAKSRTWTMGAVGEFATGAFN